MKIARGLEEENIIVGNAYDKYGSKNPLVRFLMSRFHESLDELVAIANPKSIHEIGCGEGYWVLHWFESGIEARGSDFSVKVIEIARENARAQNIPQHVFSAKSIYELSGEDDTADLLVCCEVLEHLEQPALALEALRQTARDFLILSVPREPVWRVMNLARGKYLSDFGNTPGHIQHWSRDRFLALVEKYFEIIEVKSPLPWTMLLCRSL